MIPLGSHPVWHPVFETLAYASGYGAFRSLRERRGDIIEEGQRWVIIAAAAIGGLLGSRLLGLAEEWPTVLSAFRSGRLLALLVSPGGKTIVGGLLGGWIAVETVKKLRGIRNRTGDLFTLPLCIGIAIGRLGCMMAGLADNTYGKPTSLPWGVDFGDGVSRHPLQLYEILFLILLAFWLSRPAEWSDGSRFRVFLAAYLGWRFLIDFLKPQPLIASLNLIQWACVAGLVVLATTFLVDLRFKRKEMHEQAFG
jgi:phosphatidylglycerol---prolipoprotein diacylglyceryl transferase